MQVVGGIDDQIPSVPSSNGVQIITYSKLLNQVILLLSVSTNVGLWRIDSVLIILSASLN